MLPKKVLDLFPMWEYCCPKCYTYVDAETRFCPNCKTPFNAEKWRVPPRFLKNHKVMSKYAHEVLAPKLNLEQRELLFKHFTVFFAHGFEGGDFGTDPETRYKWDSWGPTVSVTDKLSHHGRYCAKGTVGADRQDGQVKKVLDVAQPKINVRIYCRFPKLPSNNKTNTVIWINWGWDGVSMGPAHTTAQGYYWHINVNNIIPDPPFFVIEDQPLKINTWYCVEVRLEKGTGDNAITKVWFDGFLKFTHTEGTMTRNLNDVRTGLAWTDEGYGSTFVAYVDCVVVADKKIGVEVPTCSDYTTKATCEAAGCYWYDGACHSTERAPPGEGTIVLRALADSEEVTATVKVVNTDTGEVIGTYETPRDITVPLGTYILNANYEGQIQKQTAYILTAGAVFDTPFTFTKMHVLTIVSDPSPIDFTLDGEAVSTPFTRDTPSGSYEIVFPLSWFVGVDEYIFTQWEDGSVEPKRTVTLGSPEDVILTATYTLKQVEGAAPASQREIKDSLREVVGAEGDLSEDNPLPVKVTTPVTTKEQSPTEVLEGQVTLTGTAQRLPDEPCKSVTLENPITNAVVCVGHDNKVTLANGYRLQPGATYSMDVDNVNKIWVIGTATQVITYGGVN